MKFDPLSVVVATDLLESSPKLERTFRSFCGQQKEELCPKNKLSHFIDDMNGATQIGMINCACPQIHCNSKILDCVDIFLHFLNHFAVHMGYFIVAKILSCW